MPSDLLYIPLLSGVKVYLIVVSIVPVAKSLLYQNALDLFLIIVRIIICFILFFTNICSRL